MIHCSAKLKGNANSCLKDKQLLHFGFARQHKSTCHSARKLLLPKDLFAFVMNDRIVKSGPLLLTSSVTYANDSLIQSNSMSRLTRAFNNDSGISFFSVQIFRDETN